MRGGRDCGYRSEWKERREEGNNGGQRDARRAGIAQSKLFERSGQRERERERTTEIENNHAGGNNNPVHGVRVDESGAGDGGPESVPTRKHEVFE